MKQRRPVPTPAPTTPNEDYSTIAARGGDSTCSRAFDSSAPNIPRPRPLVAFLRWMSRSHLQCCSVIAAVALSALLIALCFVSSASSSEPPPSATIAPPHSWKQQLAMAHSPAGVESRLRGALWGFFSGDALAAPTHWYYGGIAQIRDDYGPRGIVDYTRPKFDLPGSILNKSNTNGGGRGSFSKKGSNGKSVIGDVINHGKREYWDPTRSIHYHATLQKGENTLEAQLARVLMRSIVSTGGAFDADHFRKAYVDFMTTPGSHNDTYASTCHRMFFANLVLRGRDPRDCPDNDSHNVDTIDGLVLPTIAALAVAGSRAGTAEGAADAAARTAAVTRRSSVLEGAGRGWGGLVYDSIVRRAGDDDGEGGRAFVGSDLTRAAKRLGSRGAPSADRPDQMTACYLSSSLPPTLDMIARYASAIEGGDGGDAAWTGLVANANVGGENVHRGSILGAVLGARAGVERLPPRMIDGLFDKDTLAGEIDAFVEAVTKG